VVAMAFIAERARGQQQDDRAQALAARADDVFADLFDQRYLRRQASADNGVNGAHVGSDRGKQGSGGRLGQDEITVSGG